MENRIFKVLTNGDFLYQTPILELGDFLYDPQKKPKKRFCFREKKEVGKTPKKKLKDSSELYFLEKFDRLC